MATRVLNILSLRLGSMGSMRAWLPSRRSTAHHMGAWSWRLSGQVRSRRSSGTYGWYLSNAMVFGVAGCGGIGCSLVSLVGEGWWEGLQVAENERSPRPFGWRLRHVPRRGEGRAYVSRRRWVAGRIGSTFLPRGRSCQPWWVDRP